MRTILANIQHAIHENETVTIGGGVFNRDELSDIVRLYKAAAKAKEALTWALGGEPMSSLEKEALDELREALK